MCAGSAATPDLEIVKFFKQNTHDSGNSNWEKRFQNNAVCMIAKLINKVSSYLLLMNPCVIRRLPGVCRPSIGFFRDLVLIAS